MIGYKAFDKNLCCRGFQFEVSKTYETGVKAEDMELCTNKVFHFCRELFKIESVSDYVLSESRICEVISGDFITDEQKIKYGTNKITILREIVGDEKNELINTGNCNTGSHNTGNCNTGSHNTGNWNTGSHNTGDCNTGNWNTGNCNTGDCNTGNWNTGNRNLGFFNTDEPTVRMFNKNTGLKIDEIRFPHFLYFTLTEWISESDATDKEKQEHAEEIKIMKGFLKSYTYKEAFRKAWDSADIEEHKQLLVLPNWDNEIFKEISGIDAEAEIAKEESNEN